MAYISNALLSTIFCVPGLGLALGMEPAQPVTFCNPLNLDYQPFAEKGRTGADPVIVPFKGRYYLFDSKYKGGFFGYRVSDDLRSWKRVLWKESLRAEILDPRSGEGYAPGVVIIDDHLYFARLGGQVILRTADPGDGSSWEVFSRTGLARFDPMYHYEHGHLYLISGALESSIEELDPKTFSAIPGTRRQQTPTYDSPTKMAAAPYGLFQGKREYEPRFSDWNTAEALDTARLLPTTPPHPGQLNSVSKESTQEAGWLTVYNNRYYLQNSAPGTACPWYSDDVYVADTINGPYHLTDYATASLKVGGFINSTGHSCVFQDFHGNWWRVTTMWIGVYAGFERRIGLFPAGFDDQGRMFTQTALGDYPLVMPSVLRTPSTASSLAGWWVLSTGKATMASSSVDGHPSSLAADENVRTWWSAMTGNPGEWLTLDLGKPMEIRAMQVNFAEQGIQSAAAEDDYHAYRLLTSLDQQTWQIAIDMSGNRTCVPHDYQVLPQPITARFVKVLNIHAAKNGLFALRDLRVFGHGGAQPPQPVPAATVLRDPQDPRNVTLTWQPVADADGYLIRYGVAPDALHLTLQYQGRDHRMLTVSCLNRDTVYSFRIDSYNGSGMTNGTVITTEH